MEKNNITYSILKRHERKTMDKLKKSTVSLGVAFAALTLSFAFLLANEQIQRPFPTDGVDGSRLLGIEKNKTDIKDENKPVKRQSGRIRGEELSYIFKTL